MDNPHSNYDLILEEENGYTFNGWQHSDLTYGTSGGVGPTLTLFASALEPASVAMLLTGIASMVAARRRRSGTA